MAEFVRLYHASNPQEAQQIVDAMVGRKAPLVEQFGEDFLVLDPTASVVDQVLLVLYKLYPNTVKQNELEKWISTKSSGYMSKVLERLKAKRLIYCSNGCKLTKLGIRYVEDRIMGSQ